MGSKCSPCDRAQQHPARGIAENNPACLGLEAVLLFDVLDASSELQALEPKGNSAPHYCIVLTTRPWPILPNWH